MKILNEEQQLTVTSSSNRILCIAGAGSGKTTTLVERIARLINNGADPCGFIVITYTNAAAAEIERRIYDDGSGDKVQAFKKLGYVGTLHGFLLRLLGKHHAMVGLPSTLAVFDDDQQAGFVEQIMAEMNIKAPKKNVMPLLKRADLIDGSRGMRTKEELIAIEYHARLRTSGLLDFDAILHYGEKLVRIFSNNELPPSSEKPWPFTHLFVDEFQDSADADARIYEAMPCAHKFMVGDPDQAIYGFRGGNVKNILQLASGCAQDVGWEVNLLETNYRCHARIADAAQRLIVHNLDRYPKTTRPAHGNGVVVAESFPSPAAEMAFVVNELMRSCAGVTRNTIPAALDELRGTAVVARTNRIAKEFADHLRGSGIQVAERKLAETPVDWRLAKLALTVAVNPWNDMAAHRLLTEVKGQAQADLLKMQAAKTMRPLCEVASMFNIEAHNRIDADLFLTACGLSSESRARVREAAAMLSARGEWTLNDLVASLAAGEERAAVDGDGVTVTTFHSAKGREWETVYMVGCEDGVCPSGRKGTDIEEERRLFYVAMTRAKKRLVITRCEARPSPFGPQIMKPADPSRFIAEAGI